MGRVMGEFHDDHIYLGDPHIDNFSQRGEIYYDIEERYDWRLLRAPSAAQCATMLVPLLREFDSGDYAVFRHSYRSTRGAAGEDVFNCIEYGDLTGWMRHLVAKDFVAVYESAHLQLSGTETMADQDLAQLLRALAIACSRLRLRQEADEHFTSALGASTPEHQPLIHLNFAGHLIRNDDIEQARKHLQLAIDLGLSVGAATQFIDAARGQLLALESSTDCRPH